MLSIYVYYTRKYEKAREKNYFIIFCVFSSQIIILARMTLAASPANVAIIAPASV